MFTSSFAILCFFYLRTILRYSGEWVRLVTKILLLCICGLVKCSDLQFNLSKSKVLKFIRSNEIYHYEYSVCGTVLEYTEKFKDLGVIFDSKLSYSFHIDDVVNRANRTLSFVERQPVGISDVRSISILYSLLVRSLIEC